MYLVRQVLHLKLFLEELLLQPALFDLLLGLCTCGPISVANDDHLLRSARHHRGHPILDDVYRINHAVH